MSKVLDIFAECVSAERKGILIKRANRQDKEFHFQNWISDRLEDAKIFFDGTKTGRNTYPDFPLVETAEGYEIKGLAYPGRWTNYDANSQVPSGYHNGRTIFYVFGRYPKSADENEYPLIDLVICHGDFLNADHKYVHKNDNVKGFGSYGDIMIRDRKMYVAPTPFGLTNGTTGQQTLILPDTTVVDDRFEQVGSLVRVEHSHIVVGYSFDLTSNKIKGTLAENPSAGTAHYFVAYRLRGIGTGEVSMKTEEAIENVIKSVDNED